LKQTLETHWATADSVKPRAASKSFWKF